MWKWRIRQAKKRLSNWWPTSWMSHTDVFGNWYISYKSPDWGSFWKTKSIWQTGLGFLGTSSCFLNHALLFPSLEASWMLTFASQAVESSLLSSNTKGRKVEAGNQVTLWQYRPFKTHPIKAIFTFKRGVALGACPIFGAAVSSSVSRGYLTKPAHPHLCDRVFTASVLLPLLLGSELSCVETLAILFPSGSSVPCRGSSTGSSLAMTNT